MPISRREFLKLSGLGLAGLLVPPSINLGALAYDAEKNSVFDLLHQYEGKTRKLMDEAWNKYRVYMVSEKNWKYEPNLAWPSEAVECVANTFESLPQEFLPIDDAITSIHLVRTPGTDFPGSGGGYNLINNHNRLMILYIAETFSLSNVLPEHQYELYKDTEKMLKATVCHEFTHAFIDKNPPILSSWIEQTGWYQHSDQSWSNTNPDTLITEALAEKLPYEDIAVSTSLMLVNPARLDDTRRNFFLNTGPFRHWSAVLAYKQGLLSLAH